MEVCTWYQDYFHCEVSNSLRQRSLCHKGHIWWYILYPLSGSQTKDTPSPHYCRLWFHQQWSHLFHWPTTIASPVIPSHCQRCLAPPWVWKWAHYRRCRWLFSALWSASAPSSNSCTKYFSILLRFGKCDSGWTSSHRWASMVVDFPLLFAGRNLLQTSNAVKAVRTLCYPSNLNSFDLIQELISLSMQKQSRMLLPSTFLGLR